MGEAKQKKLRAINGTLVEFSAAERILLVRLMYERQPKDAAERKLRKQAAGALHVRGRDWIAEQHADGVGEDGKPRVMVRMQLVDPPPAKEGEPTPRQSKLYVVTEATAKYFTEFLSGVKEEPSWELIADIEEKLQDVLAGEYETPDGLAIAGEETPPAPDATAE